MRRKTLKEKLLAIFLAVAVAVTMIPGGFALFTQDANAADTITLNGKKFEYKDAYGEWHTTTRFTGGGYEGLCAAAHRHSLTGSHSYSMAKPNATMIKLAWYYGYQKGWTSGVNGAKLSRAFNYVSTDPKTKDRGKAFNFKESTLKDMVNTVKNVKVPEGFTCYYVTPTSNTSKQAGLIWKYVPNGTLTMVKTSSVPGYNPSYAGCEYTVYKGSSTVGKFTINASGKTSNLSLPEGKYTVKETKTNANYKLDATSHSVTITSGKKSTLSVKEDATGNIALKKSFTPDSDDGYTLSGFHFHFVNTAKSSLYYDGTTDANGNVNISNMKAGQYRVTEELTDAQQKAGYSNADKQGQVITITNNQTTSMTWKNSYEKDPFLKVSKKTGDGTGVDGFHFKITAELSPRELTKETFTSYAHIEPKTTKEGFTLSDFVVNEEELADLNGAAANKETGTSTVHVTATATKPAEQVEGKALDTFKNAEENYEFVEGDALSYRNKVYIAQTNGTYTLDEIEGNDTDSVLENADLFKVFEASEDETETISIPVKITLKSVKEKENIDDPTTPNSIAEPEGWEFDYNDITWAGSADNATWDDDSTTTGPSGEIIIKDIVPGTYTVTEVLTDEQKKHFKQPEPQTQTLEGNESEEVTIVPDPLVFVVNNVPKWTDVSLKKTNAKEGGAVGGFEFTLTGTRDFDGEKINVPDITDDEGNLDFGKLYAGEYVLEETGFDPEVYMFHKKYKVEGHENPAIAFTVTGEEEEPIELEFENDPITNLFITKVDKDTQMFLQDAEFDLYEGDKKVVTFKITRGKSGKAIAQILWQDEESEIYAETDDVEDTGEEPEPNVVDENTPDNGSNTSSSNNSSNSDGNVTTMADTTEPADGGNDTAGEGEGAEESTSEGVQYNYAVLKALKRNTEYRIVETKSPQGYAGTVDYGFTFTEDMAPIIIENKAPEIHTTAKDSLTEQHMSNATAGPVTIIDTVEYHDLTPGKEYTMTGKLVLKPQTQEDVDTSSEDAKVVEAGGKAVVNTVKFTPKEKDGTVDVPLTFDAKDLEGAKTVIFESLADPKLEEENSIIATHSEVDNEDQSIYFPEVHTSAKAEDTNMNITGANEETTIIDTVEYSNVIAGKVYEMKGVLMSKETGKPIKVDGEPVTASVKFKATENGPDYNDLTEDEQAATTPEQPAEQPAEGQEGQEGQQADDASKVKLVSGSVELTFTFDSTEFAGDSLVAFEELYCKGKLVGQHKNIEDKKQTVRIPIIGTKASAGRNVIKDKVAYKNLIPGKRYIMRGVMMNKKTGEPMTIDGEALESELEFTPKKSSGIVTLEFEVNTKKLKGKTLVAFEKCFVITDESGEEVEIAAHENLDSKAQTVTFRTPQTGQVLPWFIFAALAAMVISAGYMLRKKFLLK